MVENKTFCWFNNTLFTKFRSDDFVYLNKNLSLAYSQMLDEMINKHGSFSFFYLDGLKFLNGNLIVIPSSNKSDFFIFNYFSKNNLIFIQTLDISDYLAILENKGKFSNKLELIIEREGY